MRVPTHPPQMGRGRRASSRFTPKPEQRAIIELFQTSGALVSRLTSAVGYRPATAFAALAERYRRRALGDRERGWESQRVGGATQQNNRGKVYLIVR